MWKLTSLSGISFSSLSTSLASTRTYSVIHWKMVINLKTDLVRHWSQIFRTIICLPLNKIKVIYGVLGGSQWN